MKWHIKYIIAVAVSVSAMMFLQDIIHNDITLSLIIALVVSYLYLRVEDG